MVSILWSEHRRLYLFETRTATGGVQRVSDELGRDAFVTTEEADSDGGNRLLNRIGDALSKMEQRELAPTSYRTAAAREAFAIQMEGRVVR